MFCFLLWALSSNPHSLQAADPAARPGALAELTRDARALEPLVTSSLAKDFLKATATLPVIRPRAVFLDESTKRYVTEATANTFKPDLKNKLKRVELDDSYYWNTKYGSPLAYARPLELLGQRGTETVAGKKILDFGYGTVGHLRLLASQGARVTGVDVDPLLSTLYSDPGDQGTVQNPHGPSGQIRLIEGRFPAEERTKAAVEGDYDLIISKNTLKKGYVHPERPVEPRRLLDLGVDDGAFVTVLYQALKPGGKVLIYNLSPAPSPPGQPYKHWAEGACPFARELWQDAGFRIVAFDQDDSEAARALGRALGWNGGDSPIDLDSDLFARYSLMEKPDKT